MTKNLLLLLNLIATTSVLAYPVMFTVGVMALDGPDATSNIGNICVASYLWLYPVPILVGAMKAWKSRNDQEISRLARYTLITFLGFVPIAGFFIYVILSQQIK